MENNKLNHTINSLDSFFDVEVYEGYAILCLNRVVPNIQLVNQTHFNSILDQQVPFITIVQRNQSVLLMHSLFERLHNYQGGVAFSCQREITASEIDVLKQRNQFSELIVQISISTVDDEMSKLLEPEAPVSSVRFSTLKKLSEAGVFCGLLAMPIYPFLSDSEENVIALVRLAAKMGVKFIYPSFGVVFDERAQFLRRIDRTFPIIAQRYERFYGDKSDCVSLNAEYLVEVFTNECQKYGILYEKEAILCLAKKHHKQLKNKQ